MSLLLDGTNGITFPAGGLILTGSTSGTCTVNATAISGTAVLTMPTGTDTLVGKATTDTLTNKTLVAPALGTPISGTLTNCTGLPVAGGGTGLATTTAYGVLAGGTTATGAFQNIGTGTAAQVLTSNGAGALPTFQAASGGVTTFNGSTTGLTPATATSGAITLGGTLAVANGGTGVTTSTGTGATVRGTSPSISGAVMSTMASSVLTSATAQNSTSGTSIDFTGIPSWVKRITVMFNGVSTNGSSNYQIRLGTSGGVESTGYSSASMYCSTSGINAVNSTTGFQFHTIAGGYNYHGSMTISLLTGSTWTETGIMANPTGGDFLFYSAGSKATSGTLDRVRITTVNGTDTFDAGSINIMYE